MPTPHNPPAVVRRALRKLGADIHDARRRRRLPMAVVAERAFTSRSTLQKIEAGDTNVSIGIYAGVLQALGLLDGLSQSPTSATTLLGRHWPAPTCPSTSTSSGQRDRHAMADFEVHIDLDGRTLAIGLARSNRVRGAETILFEYDRRVARRSGPVLAGARPCSDPRHLRPACRTGNVRVDRRLRARYLGASSYAAGRAPSCRTRSRAVRTLAESDYLLGVADETRLGALSFRWAGEETFQAPIRAGVPALIELGRLLQITERILRDEETDEDLQLIFAPAPPSAVRGRKRQSSINMDISPSPSFRRKPTTTAWRPGRRSRCGWPRQAGIATPVS
jgi:transcriptional regulator with XRE-family HTH domain